MADEESYDYSQSLPFITEFKNSIPNEPFIDELQENYGKLWQFKDYVDSWMLSVSRFKKNVYLLHRKMPTGPFLPLNIDEKVTLLENFHQKYVVITLQAVGSGGEDINHLHLIVVKIGGNEADFDIADVGWNVHGSPPTRTAGEVHAMDIHVVRECIPEDKLYLPKPQPICSPSNFGSGIAAIKTPSLSRS